MKKNLGKAQKKETGRPVKIESRTIRGGEENLLDRNVLSRKKDSTGKKVEGDDRHRV